MEIRPEDNEHLHKSLWSRPWIVGEPKVHGEDVAMAALITLFVLMGIAVWVAVLLTAPVTTIVLSAVVVFAWRVVYPVVLRKLMEID